MKKIFLFLALLILFCLVWSFSSKASAAITIGGIKTDTVDVSKFECPSGYIFYGPQIGPGQGMIVNGKISIQCARILIDGMPAVSSVSESNSRNQIANAYLTFVCDNDQFLTGMWGAVPRCAHFSLNGETVTWSGRPFLWCDYDGRLGLPYKFTTGSVWQPGDFLWEIGFFGQAASALDYTPPVTPAPGSFSVYSSSACSGTTRQTNTLTWTASSNAAYYYIYVDGNRVATRYPGNEEYNVTVPLGTHYYRVIAYNLSGSRIGSPSTLYIYAEDCAPPGTPVLTVTPACSGNQSVNRLNWTASSGATNYYVYRCERAGGGIGGGGFNRCTRIASLGSGTRNYNDNVNYPSTYEYYIQAYNSGNNTSSYSTRQRVDASCCFETTVNLSADDNKLKEGQSTTLRWTTQNASSCTASSNPSTGWFGSKPLNGNDSTGLLNLTTVFRLDCNGICPGRNGYDTETVVIDKVTYKGAFISEAIDINTNRDYVLRILYDPRIINTPPPGFSDIFAPIFKEIAP